MDMYFHQATQFHVCPGRPFSIDEIQYPDNWLNLATPAEIAALGLVPVATVGEAKDPTYYDHAEVLAGATLTITSTPRPLAAIKAALAERIAASRYEREIAGIVAGGIHIATDRQSQAMLSGAVQIVGRNPAALIDWKGQEGWAQIDKSTVEAIADAVGAHVQACFSAERARHEALAAIADFADLLTFDPTVTLP